ncbi:carboxypeptidase regulatory-like domain-containing protein [Methylobacter psychrophilus]|uniref:carboxypeptidase regulatory-like domain-containing protein n=1 Tax=Methylobacter psychrophilus TaxID=96941 RepID=UPI0021D4DD03|nr:carboxypeptidase regulatory-like domain-containing protein [Methylobacter psychrophilus]
MMFLLLALLIANYHEVLAATISNWEVVPDSQITVKLIKQIHGHRSKDNTVVIKLSNVSGKALAGPFRLIITGLSLKAKTKVSISNATGKIATGEPYYDLTGYIGTNFSSAGTGIVTVIIKGDNSKGSDHKTFRFKTRVERQITKTQALVIKITSPATLLTVGSTPQIIKGSVSDPDARITLNGAPVSNNNGSFEAAVTLNEGHNTIAARATDAQGQDVTDIISLSLDMTPPYLTVESPKDGDTVRSNKIAVSGLINDIVRGTVAEGQALVTVNGKAASISNRSYLVEDITLNEGDNILKIDGADNVGNTSSISIKVNYLPLAPQHIEILSGQNQTAKINAILAAPLKIKLLDEKNQPVAGKPVIFRVTEGDGMVGVDTQDQGTLVQSDAQGIAATPFKLGTRAGTGNQRVRATSTGFDGEVLFHASATVGTGNKVTVNSGNNQRGAISQPLPQPFVVAVVDEGANVVPGAQVEFKVTQGTGKFQNNQVSVTNTTDSDGRATAELTLGAEEGLDVHRVTATLVGTELYAGFTASALKAGPAGQTSITGVVLDNQDNPLPNVTIRVDGTTREAQSNAQGQFKITEAPVGSVRLIADSSTITSEGEWSTLAFNLVTIAGADNPLAAPIYLVKLDTINAKQVGDQDVTLTLPDVPGFALEVKKGSVTFPDGKKTGQLSVTPVNASKIPMAPPNGMQPQFIVTIQPIGAKFDPPAKLSLPNVDGHKPGAQVEMYSYDHDLEEFVSIGLGTVNAEGSVITSNQGVGVIKAGWHCGSQPTGSGCCSSPGECQTTSANCQIVNLPKIADVKGDCQLPKDCKSSQPDNSDLPADISGDCKKPGCPKPIADILDKPSEICKECMGDGLIGNKADGKLPDSTSQCCFQGESVSKTGLDYSVLQAKCPQKVQYKAKNHEIDGCSNSPDDLESWDNLPFATNYNLYVTNPIWGTVLGSISNEVAANQTLPCNIHDICYQSCNSDQATCDNALGDGVTASCDIGYPFPCSRADALECVEYDEEYNSCRSIGPEYTNAVANFGGTAYKDRQTQYCECC